ncbi:MAG TPA: MarR family transcriptional regulator [Candidatus Paceibacterota bacterium]|nr:MarR family transcriptional regulator [Candidatus Paceibacterota bacterium]
MSRLLRSHAGPQRPKDMQSLLQVKTLGLVAEMKNPSMKDIAEYLHILSPSATDIVNRLVRDGKLERRKDKADKRIVRLHLTPSGKKMLNAGLKQMKERLQAALSVLNAEEKSELAALLEKIIDRNNEGHTEAS